MHHYNAAAHMALCMQQYSPDLAQCDLFLFLRKKGQMKGKRSADASEVRKIMMEVLNNNTEEFQKCVQQW